METIPTRRQLTVRATIAGMLLGGFMSLSNLYVALKTGWSIGVSLTAGILAFAISAVLQKVRFTRVPFGMLENNAMQSVASAAGYMTGGGTVAAIPALMMITGQPMGGWQMFGWISAIAMLGVVMAIPMKQQMINVEQLRFPTGVAAAETLKAFPIRPQYLTTENTERTLSGPIEVGNSVVARLFRPRSEVRTGHRENGGRGEHRDRNEDVALLARAANHAPA